jgi:multidrug resistance efflux pump
MKLLAISVGAALLVGGLYVTVGEHLAGTSGDATVNARIVTVRAPIDGYLSLPVRELGARVSAQQVVGEIFDTRYDAVRLLDTENSLAALRTDLQRVTAQVTTLDQARAQLQEQTDRYQSGRVQQIEARIGEAQATLESAQARLREADSALRRTTDLTQRGLQTTITLDKAKAGREVAEQDIQSAQQRLAFLKTELESARKGVFLGDSYNDTPFSSQRIRELDLRLADLRNEQQQIDQRIAQASGQLAAERVRINKLTSATLTSATGAQVWDVLATEGEYVHRGQVLLRLADCSDILISAGVSESVFNALQPGSPAQLRLFRDDRVFDATVIRLGGSGASVLFTNLAVGASAEHLKRFHVTLSAPQLAAQGDLQCAIGRTGRLLFTSGPLLALRRVAGRLGL